MFVKKLIKIYPLLGTRIVGSFTGVACSFSSRTFGSTGSHHWRVIVIYN